MEQERERERERERSIKVTGHTTHVYVRGGGKGIPVLAESVLARGQVFHQS